MSGYVPEPWHWMAAGVVLAVLEVVLPGAALIWLGGAAFLVGLIAFVVPLGLNGQLGLFAVLAVAALAIAIYLRRRGKLDTPETPVNRGAARFIGTRATLDQPIVDGSGRLHLGDTVWAIKGPDLPAGTQVVVVGMDGATLVVERG
jgi:membrane protein implicated in regulation of membrane protease activity